MTLASSTDMFRERLLGGTDFEIIGSDRDTGISYRATVRCGEIDVASFLSIDSAVLRSSIRSGLPLSIGATLYQIEPSFGPAFLLAVCQANRVSAISVTLQSHRQIVSFIGDNPSKMADAIEVHLPSTLEWARDTLVEGSREWGRKVGHAAKDLAGLSEATFGLEHLATLERSGEAEAYEAVCKETVLPAPTLENLRAKGIPPTVAFGIVSCWRMLKQRPNRNPAFRLKYVRDLPFFFANLESCLTLDDFAEVVASYVHELARDASAVVGTRLPKFAKRIRYREFHWQDDIVLRTILAIDALPDADSQWVAAAEGLSSRSGVREVSGLPLPTRPAVPLEKLTRSGSGLPEPPSIDRIGVDLGITGLELGNYVTGREGERLARLVAEAFGDLRHLLGDWVVPLCRRGNLSVALGARGKGKRLCPLRASPARHQPDEIARRRCHRPRVRPLPGSHARRAWPQRRISLPVRANVASPSERPSGCGGDESGDAGDFGNVLPRTCYRRGRAQSLVPPRVDQNTRLRPGTAATRVL